MPAPVSALNAPLASIPGKWLLLLIPFVDCLQVVSLPQPRALRPCLTPSTLLRSLLAVCTLTLPLPHQLEIHYVHELRGRQVLWVSTGLVALLLLLLLLLYVLRVPPLRPLARPAFSAAATNPPAPSLSISITHSLSHTHTHTHTCLYFHSFFPLSLSHPSPLFLSPRRVPFGPATAPSAHLEPLHARCAWPASTLGKCMPCCHCCHCCCCMYCGYRLYARCLAPPLGRSH